MEVYNNGNMGKLHVTIGRLKVENNFLQQASAMLERENIEVNHKRVQRFMRDINLYAIYPRSNTAVKDKKNAIFLYLLEGLLITKSYYVWQVDCWIQAK